MTLGSATSIGGSGDISSEVNSVVALPNGRVYLGGVFLNPGGNTAASYAAWWDPTASAWKSIDGSATAKVGNMVWSIAVSGSRVVLGGDFTDAAGLATADHVVEWTGTAWKAYGSNGSGDGALNYRVYDVAFYGSNVLVGGYFDTIGGNAALTGVAAWNGSKWLALGSPATVGKAVSGSNVSGRTLYVSGTVVALAGIAAANGIAAYGLPAAPTAPRSLVGTPGSKKVSLSWTAPLAANGAAVRDYVVQYRKSARHL